jgi:hypothetical protein
MEEDIMKLLPKMLFAIAVPIFIVGLIVSFSPSGWFASEWTVALPFGVILLGMGMIAWRIEDEVARFDREQQLKNAPSIKPAEADAKQAATQRAEAERHRARKAFLGKLEPHV